MAERRERRVWSRTRGQWIRGTSIVFAGALAGAGALFGLITALVRTAGAYLEPYTGTFPHPTFGGAGIGALAVGLAAAGTWGHFTRPRLLTTDTDRVVGDTTGAVLWDGSDLDAPDSAADREEVT